MSLHKVQIRRLIKTHVKNSKTLHTCIFEFSEGNVLVYWKAEGYIQVSWDEFLNCKTLVCCKVRNNIDPFILCTFCHKDVWIHHRLRNYIIRWKVRHSGQWALQHVRCHTMKILLVRLGKDVFSFSKNPLEFLLLLRIWCFLEACVLTLFYKLRKKSILEINHRVKGRSKGR